MSKPSMFADLVAAIQELPTGHRKTSLALACNETAREFWALVDDVHSAGKASKAAPKATKPTPPTKRNANDTTCETSRPGRLR